MTIEDAFRKQRVYQNNRYNETSSPKNLNNDAYKSVASKMRTLPAGFYDRKVLMEKVKLLSSPQMGLNFKDGIMIKIIRDNPSRYREVFKNGSVIGYEVL